jgi:hypothetical protein
MRRSMPPTTPVVHLTATVTDDRACGEPRVAIGITREAYGETDRGQLAELSPADARAYAALLVRAAEAAERQVAERQAATLVARGQAA